MLLFVFLLFLTEFYELYMWTKWGELNKHIISDHDHEQNKIAILSRITFIKNGAPLLIRLKVLFSSSLFFAIRVKKLQCTFSSRLNSFATNSNKVLINFTHNFAHSAPVSLSVKKFFAYSIIRASFLTLTNQSTSKKTHAPQQKIVFYKNWTNDWT